MIPARLEDIINKALEKDRNLRYQHASEMRSDLQRLKRDTDTGRTVSPSAGAGEESRIAAGPASGQHSAAGSGTSAAQIRNFPFAKIAAIIAALSTGFRRRFLLAETASDPVPSSANPTTVAVLPFQNMGSDKDTDFLRLALPDEIATALSYVHSISIRPFATTSKYSGAGVDLQQAGKEMHVSDIVTGHYMKEGDQLQITLEAVDVANNRTLWRDTMTVAAPNMIAMRSEITTKVRQGLVPALGAGGDSAGGATHPKNEEAYDLYLRSVSMPHDAAPNKDAIAMLERAVGLDPSYAPAWGALGLRYYFDSQYGGGGEGMFQRSNTAYERALALDPDLTSAASQFIANRVERGDLARAYKDADDLVKRQPGNAQAHMARSYVLRYAGLLDESARDCDATISLDPGNYLYRSCSLTFSQMGNPERGMDFLRLDPGSEWTNANTVRILWRESKIAEAREAAQNLPSEQHQIIRICTEHTLPAESASPELDQVIHELEPQVAGNPDPENRYVFATTVAFCGAKASALRMLKTVIDAHYCAYTALQRDPLLVPLRNAPEYAQLLSAAKQCRDNFLAEKSQLSN